LQPRNVACDVTQQVKNGWLLNSSFTRVTSDGNNYLNKSCFNRGCNPAAFKILLYPWMK
jgi:hypothetical protein